MNYLCSFVWKNKKNSKFLKIKDLVDSHNFSPLGDEMKQKIKSHF